MTTVITSKFTFTEILDPTHFHCIRYIGPPVNIDKSAVYYLFETAAEEEKGSFVASLAFTWTGEGESVLVLPFWMKEFDFIHRTKVLRFTKITDVVEFSGKLQIEFFTPLQHPNLPFEQILPEVLGSKRPLCNGTVLPVYWKGQRFLLKVFAEGIEEGRGKMFWFDLGKGTLHIQIPSKPSKSRIENDNLKILLSGSWSDEFKILKYHLTTQEFDDADKQIFLICGIPLPLQIDFMDALGIEYEPLDMSQLIPEEHLQIFEEEELLNFNDNSGGFKFIGEVEKISSSLMTEILRKLSRKSILMTAARSIESSASLIQLEKSARRFNFQVNCCEFGGPSEAERIEIIRRECGRNFYGDGNGDGDGDGFIEDYKWTLNSMGIVDLMRLGRLFSSLKSSEPDFAFKKAIEIVKESESELSSATILSGKSGNFNFYGYGKIQKEFAELVKGPLVNPEAYDHFGLPKSSGFLVYGPTGCGKTALCLKTLTSHPFNVLFTVFHVPSASQLLSKYFGETEANIRKLFAQARERKPAIIFIDQIETLGRKRGIEDASGGGDANDRYLSTLLNEMDGISGNEGVTVIACANRIELLDEALLRPGRLDRHILLDLPTKEDRKEIFKGFLGGPIKDDQVEEILNETEGWSGADIKQFCKHK